MSQPEAVDLTQKYVQHLRTKHVIYACRICESQPKFRERALALNHLKKTHKDEFPADREKAEAFTTRSLLHIDKSDFARRGKRQADASPSAPDSPASTRASCSLSAVPTGCHLRNSGQSGVLDVSGGREVSRRSPKKKRAVGLGSSPTSSARTADSDEEGSKANSIRSSRPAGVGHTHPRTKDPDFRPRTAQGRLFDHQSSPKKGHSNIRSNPSMQQKLLSRQQDVFNPVQPSTPPPSTPPRGDVATKSSLLKGNTSPQSNRLARSVIPISVLSPPSRTSNAGRHSPKNAASPHGHGREHEAQIKPNVILQPVTTSVDQDQLLAEVKGIYAGLVMVEGKCVQVDTKQMELVKNASPGRPPPLTNEQYQALISLHRTLLQEHHDFFLASQHPQATPGVRRLAVKYAMPARLWKSGIQSFLELLRNRLPDSYEHMLAFIYMAYSIMTLLLETVPAFKSTWIECLGDLARYRMAIVEREPDEAEDSSWENEADESDSGELLNMRKRNESKKHYLETLPPEEAKHRRNRKRRKAYNDQEREIWSQVSFDWYVKASIYSPDVGILHHHLAILSQTNEIQQLFYYGKSLVVPKPFEASRESVQTLFGPCFGQKKWRPSALKFERAFISMHAIMFNRKNMDQFDEMVDPFLRRLDRYITAKGQAFLESTGFHMAIANAQALLDYGKLTNPVVKTLLDTSIPALDVDMDVATDSENDAKVFEMALRLFCRSTSAVLSHVNDENILSFIHCTLVLIHRVSLSPAAMELLEPDFPWQPLATLLNSLLQSYSDYSRILGDVIPVPAITGARPFREDFALREISWTNRYYPQGWFDGKNMYRSDQFIDNALLVDRYRPERILWLGAQIAKHVDSLQYNHVEHRFLSSVKHSDMRSDTECLNEQESVTLAGDVVDDISMASGVS